MEDNHGPDDLFGSNTFYQSDGPHEFPPPSAILRVEFGARTRQGRLRPVNEDHYIVIRMGRYQETVLSSLPDGVIANRFDEYGYAMVVADGMGDTGEGETASRLAIATLVHLVRHFGKWNLRIDNPIAREIMDRAERFYRHVDNMIVHEARTGAQRHLQTTLTATFGAGRDLFFAHVGHSRAYLFRQGQLLRLTRDHTIGRNRATKVPVAPLVNVNVTSRDLLHILANTVGMGGSIGPQIDIERFRLHDQDLVLVCTNGLTDAVDEEVIAEVLASDRSPDEQSQALIDYATTLGNDDDVTALVARYHLPGDEE